MLVGILIIFTSTILLAYWFRYSCLLLMRNCEEEAAQAAVEPAFQISEVQAKLRAGTELDSVHAALNRDYAVLVYLIQHAVGLEMQSLEERLLMLDYRVMKLWYRLARTALPEQGRQALSEMASVVSILSVRIAQRAASRA